MGPLGCVVHVIGMYRGPQKGSAQRAHGLDCRNPGSGS